MKKIKTFLILLAFLGLSINAALAQYVITKNGSNYHATGPGGWSAEGNTIQSVINTIRSNNLGGSCSIQFGSGGSNFLDIGAANITFEDSGGHIWTTVTLTGRLGSSYNTANSGAIVMKDGLTLNSTAYISNSSTSSNACTIYIASGILNINGGTVRADGGVAIVNTSVYRINIKDALVLGYGTARAIYNTSSGAINISSSAGAETRVHSDNAIAIDNGGTGKITITGGGKAELDYYYPYISSGCTNTGYGTIFLNNSGTSTDTRLEILGGTVFNHTGDGNAIRNNSTGGVIIGTDHDYEASTAVFTWAGVAIWNNNTGALSIWTDYYGTIVSATTGRAIYNASTGKVTISLGVSITSANVNSNQGTIVLDGAGGATERLVIEAGGGVSNTAAGGIAIRNNSTGSVTVDAASEGPGSVLATTGIAIHNTSTGTINVKGGRVSVTGDGGRAIVNASSGTVNISSPSRVTATGGGRAVYNSSNGAINISGGTIESDIWVAVVNYAAGKITISGDALVTSGMWDKAYGTIYQFNNESSSAVRLEITGGKVQNTSTGHAIYNASAGAMNISGGMILAKEGHAVHNNSSGTITFSKGIAFAYGTAATDVISSSYSGSTNNTVLAAWNKGAGHTNYQEGSSTDIFKLPATGMATWGKQGNTWSGIYAASGSTSGFIQVDGVTIGGVGIEEETSLMESVQVYPNPTNGELRIENGELRIKDIEIFDIYGRNVGFKFPSKNLEGWQPQADGVVLDISNFPAGIYFLKIHTESGIVTKKVVKQ